MAAAATTHGRGSPIVPTATTPCALCAGACPRETRSCFGGPQGACRLTLRLWLAHCQKMMLLIEAFGASMPAQMSRLVGTKALMRNGSGTGLPVSGWMDELTSCLALSYCSRVAASTQTPSLPAALILASHPRANATASCSCCPLARSVSGLVVL